MKKVISLLLVILLLGCSAAFAEDGFGVKVIGGSETASESVSLDDLKIDVQVDIPGFGRLKATSYNVQDTFEQYKLQSDNRTTIKSGLEAQFVLLKFDILNTTTKPMNYLTDVEVKAVNDDLYEFAGWYGQYDWNKSGGNTKVSAEAILKSDDYFAIDPMYTGHYVVGCTLPNAVIEEKTPLRLEFKIGGNEITFNIRK